MSSVCVCVCKGDRRGSAVLMWWHDVYFQPGTNEDFYRLTSDAFYIFISETGTLRHSTLIPSRKIITFVPKNDWAAWDLGNNCCQMIHTGTWHSFISWCQSGLEGFTDRLKVMLTDVSHIINIRTDSHLLFLLLSTDSSHQVTASLTHEYHELHLTMCILV